MGGAGASAPALPPRPPGALPSPGFPSFRARERGGAGLAPAQRSRGRERARAAPNPAAPRSPPGRCGCRSHGSAAGMRRAPGTGSAAARGHVRWPGAARDHELTARVSCSMLSCFVSACSACGGAVGGGPDPDAGCTRNPARSRPSRFRISAHPPSRGPACRGGDVTLSLRDLLSSLDCRELPKARMNSVTHPGPEAAALDCRA